MFEFSHWIQEAQEAHEAALLPQLESTEARIGWAVLASPLEAGRQWVGDGGSWGQDLGWPREEEEGREGGGRGPTL